MKSKFFSRLTVLCALVSAVAFSPQFFVPGHADETNIARASQSDARLKKLENLMFDYVNAERQKAGLQQLVLDSILSDISRAHSVEMRDKNYFAHESPTKELRDPIDRYRLGKGSTPRLVAENIFRSWGSKHEIDDADAKKAHDSLMNSPGHKANILRDGPTRIGLGFITNANGDLWVTQMFSKP